MGLLAASAENAQPTLQLVEPRSSVVIKRERQPLLVLPPQRSRASPQTARLQVGQGRPGGSGRVKAMQCLPPSTMALTRKVLVEAQQAWNHKLHAHEPVEELNTRHAA